MIGRTNSKAESEAKKSYFCSGILNEEFFLNKTKGVFCCFFKERGGSFLGSKPVCRTDRQTAPGISVRTEMHNWSRNR